MAKEGGGGASVWVLHRVNRPGVCFCRILAGRQYMLPAGVLPHILLLHGFHGCKLHACVVRHLVDEVEKKKRKERLRR